MTKTQFKKLKKKISKGKDCTEKECLQCWSYLMNIPLETLEARLAQIRNEELLTVPFDLNDGINEEEKDDE